MIETSNLEPGVETLVHIGPGSLLRLDAYGADRFRHILILEPERERAALLAKQLSNVERAQVVHGALAAGAGEGELLRWNLERLASLKPATPLLSELLPGARIIAKQPIPLVTPSGLLAAVEAPLSPLHLVVAFSGEEQEALSVWKADGLLAKTGFIELHCAESQLFEGATPRAAIEAWLEEEGFVLVARDLSDRDWPVLQFRADVTGKALTAAQERIAELEHQRDAQQTVQADLQGKDERIGALEGELRALGEKADYRSKRIEELERKLGEYEALLDEAHERCARADRQCQQAYADLGVSTRMQALLQADLEDLRARFAEAQEVRASQEALLHKLTPRLQQAAAQLRHLQSDEDNGLSVNGRPPAPMLESEKKSQRSGKRTRSKRGSDAASKTR